jgi:creatinine amidohydrolase
MDMAAIWTFSASRFEELEEHDIFHACALETSFMMVLRPDLVNLDKLEKEIPPKFTEETGYRRLRLGKKGVEFSWLIDDVSKSGVIGDPTKASAEIGRTVLQALVDNICDVLREIRKS